MGPESSHTHSALFMGVGAAPLSRIYYNTTPASWLFNWVYWLSAGGNSGDAVIETQNTWCIYGDGREMESSHTAQRRRRDKRVKMCRVPSASCALSGVIAYSCAQMIICDSVCYLSMQNFDVGRFCISIIKAGALCVCARMRAPKFGYDSRPKG